MKKSKQRIIKASKDWDLFGTLDYNRPLVPGHVKKLEESIKQSNDLHLHPIVVNEDMKVVDGQHRLQAAKNLSLPIYYVVDDNYDSQKIMLTNFAQKNWTLENFIEYWASMGIKDYLKLKEYKKQYDLTYFLLLEWLHDGRRSCIGKECREGKLELNPNANALKGLNNAYRFIEFLKKNDYKPIKIFTQRAFHQGLRKLFFSPLLEVERFYEKLNEYPHNFRYEENWKSYVEQLANIYNYKSRKDLLTVIKKQDRLELSY